MKNPVVAYALARIGVFAGILTVLLLLGFNGIYSTFIAAALALAISLLFMGKLRDAASSKVYARVKRDKEEGIEDADSDLENAVLDAKSSRVKKG